MGVIDPIRRHHWSNVGPRLRSRLEPSLFKLGPPPLVWAMRIMSAARRRKRLANSSLRWIKLGTGKFVSVLGLPTTLRRTRRVITDNFATTLAPRFPGPRLTTKKFFSLPPSSYDLVILVKNLLH